MLGKERLKVEEGNQSQENHSGKENPKSNQSAQSDVFYVLHHGLILNGNPGKPKV